MIEIREYLDAGGYSPYAKWFDGLNPQAAAKVVIAVTRMGHGNLSNSKGVGAGVHECRIEFGPGYRVYFGREGDRFVILRVVAPRNGSKAISARPRLCGATTRRGNGGRAEPWH